MLLLRVYCCTPIAVLAVYLSRWRQKVKLPIIVYWRSLYFIPYVTMIGHWAQKFNDQSTRITQEISPQRPSGLLTTLWFFFRGSLLHKALCYRKRFDCIYQRDRRISVYWQSSPLQYSATFLSFFCLNRSCFYLGFGLSGIAKSRARYK